MHPSTEKIGSRVGQIWDKPYPAQHTKLAFGTSDYVAAPPAETSIRFESQRFRSRFLALTMLM